MADFSSDQTEARRQENSNFKIQKNSQHIEFYTQLS